MTLMLVLLSVLVGQSATSSLPLDASTLTVGPSMTVATIGTGKIKGEPWRLAWSPDQQQFYVAGRKVIFYLDGLTPREERSFSFQVKARFPVRAIIPDSKAYSYYEPDLRAEATGKEITAGTLSAQEEPKK